MGFYIQSGFNPEYPTQIECWFLGDKVPQWLSDRARITFMDGDGNKTLGMRNLSGGGYEILDITGKIHLVQVKRSNDPVCRDLSNGRIFSISLTKLGYLYKKE